MMYLKQFPDICREMGFDVEEKAKTITLRITDINYSIDINKKLFLEDLELILDSYSEVREAIAIFEAKTKSGKYDNLDATELQKLKCVFDKAWETGRLKDDTGMFQTEVDTCHQHAEYLKAVLEKLLEKLKKEVDKARLYSTSSHDFPIVMKQIDASCYKAYVPTKSNNGFIVQEYIFDLNDIGKNDEKKIRAQFDELFQRTNTADSYRLLAELSIKGGLLDSERSALFASKTLKGVCIMNKTVPTIEMNPIDDIQHLLEESGCYESEIEMMKTAGTYDVFVRKVHDAIDWGYLCTQMTELENNTIAAAIDKVHGMTTKTEDDA